MGKASKKLHQSSRRKPRDSNRSTSSSRHHSRDSSVHTFAIQDHPSGVALPYPEVPRPPVPAIPTSAPRAPQPVIVRQQGLYVTSRPPEQYSAEQRPWPGPPVREPRAPVNSDPEKGISDFGTEELKDLSVIPTKTQPRWKNRKCILILLLIFTLFLVTPIAIGAGIAAKKRQDNQKKKAGDGEAIPGSGNFDNGLSYGDWYCSGCRCYTDEESMNKCLESLNSKSTR